jgi:hypothetical protein
LVFKNPQQSLVSPTQSTMSEGDFSTTMLLIATQIGKYSTIVKYITEYLYESRQSGIPVIVSSIKPGRPKNCS